MIRKILLAVDFSNLSGHALVYGAEVARKTGASLTLVHGVNLPRWMDHPQSPGEKAIAELARKRLDDLARRHELEGLSVQTQVFTGPVEVGIQKLAKELNSDLILVAKHGRNVLERFFLGSMTEKILRTSLIPVLVLADRGAETVHWSTIVCAVDSSAMTVQLLHYAARWSRKYGQRLLILHVADLEPEVVATIKPSKGLFERYSKDKEQELQKIFSKFDQPPRVDFRTVQGKPYSQIILTAEEERADLLIIGARGDWVRKGMGIGSTARAILQNATIPVVVSPN